MEGIVTIGCNMDFSNYPYDSHRCQFLMGSTGFSDQLMTFQTTYSYSETGQRPLQYRVTNCQWNLDFCCCQVFWQKWTNRISIFLFHTSIINLFCSWHTLININLFRRLINLCQCASFMLVPNKNILIRFVHFCQNTWH